MDEKQQVQEEYNEKIKAIVSGQGEKAKTSPVYGKPIKIKVTRKKRHDITTQNVAVSPNVMSGRLNEKFIELLEELASIMAKRGEQFRAKAYQRAQETIILYPDELTPENYTKIKSAPGIGETIMKKFAEYVRTGTLRMLERERADPQNLFSDIYGVGPKKAKDLVDKGIKSIAELREKQMELLNSVQRVGLKYYEDILARIPRSEIDEYDQIFDKEFKDVASSGAKYEIVGSYRRGAKTSGDIDVIVTAKDSTVFKNFIDRLVETGIIIEILSRGSTKSLVIGKLGQSPHARRLDFLYSTPEEYPFALLYFTGSKIFNTVMRGRALQMGYSLNEHGMYSMDFGTHGKKTKGAKVDTTFTDERAIFDFLKMEYKEPDERIDGRAVIALSGSPKVDLEAIEKAVEKQEGPVLLPLSEHVVDTTPLRIFNAHGNVAFSLISRPLVGVLNEKRRKPLKKTRKLRIVPALLQKETGPEKEEEKMRRMEEEAMEKVIEKGRKEEAIKSEAAKIAREEEAMQKVIEKGRKEKATDKAARKTKKTKEEKAKEKAEEKAKEKTRKMEEKAMEKAIAKGKKASEKAAKAAANNRTKKIRKTPPQNKIKISTQPNQMSTSSCLAVMATSTDPILHSIQHFKTSGAGVLDTLSEETLNAMLVKSNDAYYNVGEGDVALLSDNEFDILKEYIEAKYPKNTVVKDIGAPISGRNKAVLPYQMASMDKIKPDTGALLAWKAKYHGPYVISCKLDGVSGLYSTEGPIPKLYTRGNGRIGQDISHFIPYLNLPSIKNVVVRGEFIMSKSIFATKYADKFANARNLVAGTINRLHMDDTIRDIHFVTYEVIVPKQSPSKQMQYLKDQGFMVVQNDTVQDVTNDTLSDVLVDWRKNYAYEIDGIIVADDHVYPRASGNPDHAFAFKMVLSDQMAEAKVLDVIWTASKDGYLKPRVKIEPINLSGVKIEYATGFNGAFIQDNRIGLGATIQIIRSGDVIPHIRAVIVQAEQPKMPAIPYKWNDTHVDVMLENRESDETVREKNITGFFRGIEVDGLSAGNVTKIISSGYDTVAKILRMSKADFLTIEGFKDKMATKLHDGILAKVEAATLADIMAASNVFGRGFSDKKIALILEEYPHVLTSDETPAEKTRKLASVKGMASKTAAAFVEHIPAFLEFLDDCRLSGKLANPASKASKPSTDTSHPLYKKSIVMSGTRDKELEAALAGIGAVLGSGVSSKTFAVISPDVNSATGKVATARELGIAIYSPSDFQAKYFSK